MNGKKAKKIRREIYGDHSQRARSFRRGKMMGPLGLLGKEAGTVYCAGLRAEYKAAKKSYAAKRGPR